MVDNPQFNNEGEKLANVAWLNERFRSGASVWGDEILKRMRAFSRPIIFDLNNVLVTYKSPYRPNPMAKESLQRAKSIGNTFIITSAGEWELQQEELERLNLWNEKIVLLTGNNYIAPEMVTGRDIGGMPQLHRFWRPRAETPAYDKAISDFIVLAKLRGLDCTAEDFYKTGAWKRVAPIFLKPYNIPLVDDAPEGYRNNPGIQGIGVRNWELVFLDTGNEERYKTLLLDDDGIPTILGAVEQIRKYYEGVDK